MGAFDKFRGIYQGRHEYARNWKAKTGGKVLGYFCTYVPEEILYAGGILPVRILGSHEPAEVTLPYLATWFCPFCRDCLAQGLLGRYDYLDGIVIGQSCMHIRQSFGIWQQHIPVSYSYFLPVPHAMQSPHARPFLTGEFEDFKKSLEKWLGKTITNDDLDRGIEVYNTNRRLMKEVYQFRKKREPPLTGAEALLMVVGSQLADKAEHSRMVEKALQELPTRKPKRETGIRLMSIGSENDALDFI